MVFDGFCVNEFGSSLNTVPFEQDQPKVLLYEDLTKKNFPYDRVKIKNSPDVGNVFLNDLTLDFLTSEIQNSPTIPNCVFQSNEGICYICDTLYTLNSVNNDCIYCNDNYIGFLKKCVDNSKIDSGSNLINPNNNLSNFTYNSINSEYNDVFKPRDFNISSSVDINNPNPFETYKTNPFIIFQNIRRHNFVKVNIENSNTVLYFYKNFKNPFYWIYFRSNSNPSGLSTVKKIWNYDKLNNHTISFGFSYETFNNSYSDNSFNVSFVRKKLTYLGSNRIDPTPPEFSYRFFRVSIPSLISMVNKIDSNFQFYNLPFTANFNLFENRKLRINKLFTFESIPINADFPNAPFSTNISEGNNMILVLCSSGCAICQNQIFCEECIQGYFKKNNVCLKCSDQCETCINSSDHCTKCKDETKMINDKCFINIPNCIHRFQNECWICEDGYENKITECVLCGTKQYFDPNDKICINYPPNCSSINEFGNCIECDYGYKLQFQKCYELFYPVEIKRGVFKDIKSPTGFQYCSHGCSYCLDANTCLICQINYFLQNKKCLNCPENCATCVTSNICKVCYPDYFLKNDDKCTHKDHIYYRQYLYEKKLIQMMIGWKIYKNNVLEKLDQKYQEIEGCLVYSFKKNKCLRCRPEYYLDLDKCTKCLTGCGYCDRKDICLSCENNYKLKQEGAKIFCQEVKVSLIYI